MNLTVIESLLSQSADVTSKIATNGSHLIIGGSGGGSIPIQRPQNDIISTALPMTILYTLILVTGAFGNVCACIVIARNKYMRTATNYYLFSLSISDLLLLILGLPYDVYNLWHLDEPFTFGELFCFARGLTSETCTNASVLTITAFTIERYLAICHPFRAHTMSKLSRVVRLIMIIWVCALAGALPLAMQFGIDVDSMCTITDPISYSFELSFLFFFVIPGVVISVLYVFIGIHLKRSESLQRASKDQERCVNLLASSAAGHNNHHKNNNNNDNNKNSGSSPSLRHHQRGANNNDNINTRSTETLHNNTTTYNPLSKTDKSSPIMSKYRISLLRENSYSKFKPTHSKDVGNNKSSPIPMMINDGKHTPSTTTTTNTHHLHHTTLTTTTTTTTTSSSNQNHHQTANHNHHPHHNSIGNGNLTTSTTHYPVHKYQHHFCPEARGSIRSNNGVTHTTGSGSNGNASSCTSSRRAVIKMLVAVVVAFFICWSPFHAQRLMAICLPNPTDLEERIFKILTSISGVTYYLSATINPILYSILSVKFRQAFKDTIGRCSCRSHPETNRIGIHVEVESEYIR
ncbi:pyrokinin-1 receptor-like isoform X2 [Brevipalpus obovatus]|uniref:pyrokinin-1 receptor-like isoform X2 n=1 Tax=Brevipalpus obovatus TaxID=246614 RepID=UPI003D9DBD29